ncbi:hypothetical protein [Rhodobacter maris]|uniref:Uncharacterized protein n=1 Tax=Rhodobacter maris TaxID=446682 RepID=A0A285TH63_9RHOB|nr:hypothetical protein [Rhodobacter maris]SOC21574.1 hypothetical protein SAMN05877831_1245 [Rhodobacter maris]
MSILKDVLADLASMFVADARLTGAILALVAVAAMLVWAGLPSLVGGAVLLVGCLAVLVLAVRREAARRARR